MIHLRMDGSSALPTDGSASLGTWAEDVSFSERIF